MYLNQRLLGLSVRCGSHKTLLVTVGTSFVCFVLCVVLNYVVAPLALRAAKQAISRAEDLALEPGKLLDVIYKGYLTCLSRFGF